MGDSVGTLKPRGTNVPVGFDPSWVISLYGFVVFIHDDINRLDRWYYNDSVTVGAPLDRPGGGWRGTPRRSTGRGNASHCVGFTSGTAVFPSRSVLLFTLLRFTPIILISFLLVFTGLDFLTDNLDVSLGAGFFAFDAFTVELSSRSARTVLFLVIVDVFRVHVFADATLTGIGLVLVMFVSTVL